VPHRFADKQRKGFIHLTPALSSKERGPSREIGENRQSVEGEGTLDETEL
jgi:hypothetical protein